MYLKRCEKQNYNLIRHMLQPSPSTCLENLNRKTTTTTLLDKYLGTLRAYHANKFSYTTQVQYKEDIP